MYLNYTYMLSRAVFYQSNQADITENIGICRGNKVGVYYHHVLLRYCPLTTGRVQNDPPANDKYAAEFVYLLPPTIRAFHLKSEKWLDLKVNRIDDVIWNDEASKSLGIKEKTKQLIYALISNHIEAQKSTDLISGKGSGLVMRALSQGLHL